MRCCALVLLALAAGSARAQDLHQGWLHELLDLDRDRATAVYQRVAADGDQPQAHRALALARLVELGKASSNRPFLEQIREVAPELVAGAGPPTFPRIVRGLASRRARQADILAADPTATGRRILDPRPLTTAVLGPAGRNADLARRMEERRELLDSLHRARVGGAAPETLRRIERQLVVKRVGDPAQRRRMGMFLLEYLLDGKEEQAVLFEQLYRPGRGLRPSAAGADPEVTVRTALRQINRDIRRRSPDPWERDLMRRLRRHLQGLENQKRATDAVTLLRRLERFGLRWGR